MKSQPIDKTTHIQYGKLIRIVLASCYDDIYKRDAKEIVPGSIHSIVDRPNRQSRRNGDMGVWVDGLTEPVFVRFWGWKPYVEPVQMTRVKPVQEMTRVKKN